MPRQTAIRRLSVCAQAMPGSPRHAASSPARLASLPICFPTEDEVLKALGDSHCAGEAEKATHQRLQNKPPVRTSAPGAQPPRKTTALSAAPTPRNSTPRKQTPRNADASSAATTPISQSPSGPRDKGKRGSLSKLYRKIAGMEK